jgi:hypothetical protein
MPTHREFPLVVKDLHAPTNVIHLVDDRGATTPLDDIDQQQLWRVCREL